MKTLRTLLIALGLAVAIAAQAAPAAPTPAAPQLSGKVTAAGQPLPGAVITATQGAKSVTATSAADGSFSFNDLNPGDCILKVTMTGFAPASQTVTIPPTAPVALDLTLLPYTGPPAQTETPAQVEAPPPTAPGQKPAAKPSAQPNASAQAAANALAVNGSVDNGAASPFFQMPAFGNNRRGQNSLYNGSVGGTFDLSAWDAAPFSLNGQQTTRPSYAHATALASVGGPLIIPHFFNASNAPFFFVGYQGTRSNNDTVATGLVPTLDERSGNLTAFSSPITNPSTGQPYNNNQVPVSAQAAALLSYYPLPNTTGNPLFNYQTAVVSALHQDGMQIRLNKFINAKNQLAANIGLQSTRTSTPNFFGFLDTGDTFGSNSNFTWRHSFTARLYGTLSYTFNRLSSTTNPFFANATNVEGLAGIAGGDTAPADWGPPSLSFSSGLQGLSDGLPQANHNQTNTLGYSGYWNHGNSNFNFGGDYKRFQVNENQQQNPRGGFTFNGSATGNDLADFLIGTPDAATVQFGNADKYFRSSGADAFITDDWRAFDSVSFNLGLRWEYSSPISELYGRLVNLDVAPGFTAVAPIVGSSPTGSLSGATYPASLLRPDWSAIQPRFALAWRPLPASSLVVHAGYGIYYNTSVYQNIASQMAQQAPLSTSLSIANSAAHPLTLANGLQATGVSQPDLFAVDPNFRVGYVQSWNASVQQDLPYALTMHLSYLGEHGTHAAQEFLPNTYPVGGANPCPSCPSGFTYLTSGGESDLESGTAELQRRFIGGFSADAQYTWSKAEDDGALGGHGTGTPLIAQDWRNLRGEWALSNFNQTQKLTFTSQYTTGIGVHGGALLKGWEGAVYKGWTLQSSLTAASGLPLTPATFAIVPGTGTPETIRPALTGVSVYAAPTGLHLNPAAYATPAAGTWGNAGRDSITGPSQFGLNLSMQRNFPVTDRISGNFRFDANNVLNQVTYPSWDTVIGSAQFGLPLTANAMRSMQATVRFTF